MQLRIIAIITILTLTLSCTRSDVRDQITEQHRDKWVALAKQLPTDKKLELYDKVYDSRFHPRDVIIADSFEGDGHEAFNATILRINSESDFIKYLPIIYSLNRSENFNICDPENLRKLREKAQAVHAQRRIIEGVKFSKCTLKGTKLE